MEVFSLVNGLMAIGSGLLVFAVVLVVLEGTFEGKSLLEGVLAAVGVILCGGYAWWVGATLTRAQRVGIRGIDSPDEVIFAVTAVGLFVLLLAAPMLDVASRRGALLAVLAVGLLNVGFNVVMAGAPQKPETIREPAVQESVSSAITLGELGRYAKRAERARENRLKPTHGIFVKRSDDTWLIQEAPQLPGEGWRLVLFPAR